MGHKETSIRKSTLLVYLDQTCDISYVHCQWKMIAYTINPKPISYSWFPFLLGPQVMYPRYLEGAGKLANVVALSRTRTDIDSAIPQAWDS
jgi:hypothetical protein